MKAVSATTSYFSSQETTLDFSEEGLFQQTLTLLKAFPAEGNTQIERGVVILRPFLQRGLERLFCRI